MISVDFCVDCAWYENQAPEDICLNPKFEILNLDVVKGKLVFPYCLDVRKNRLVNAVTTNCSGFKKLEL